MKLDDQVKQLTELMADLVPAADRLVQHQEKNEKSITALTNAIDQLVVSQGKIIDADKNTSLALSEMRTSTMRLAEAIEKFGC